MTKLISMGMLGRTATVVFGDELVVGDKDLVVGDELVVGDKDLVVGDELVVGDKEIVVDDADAVEEDTDSFCKGCLVSPDTGLL